jgi:F-type H+-transporting ATPase subunit a
MKKAVSLSLSLAVALLAAGGGTVLAPASARAQDSAATAGATPTHDADSATAAVASQEARGHGPEAGQAGEGARGAAVDIITPHITDSRSIDYPCLDRAEGFVCEHHIQQWPLVHLGGLTLDLTPTKHVIWMSIAAIVCALVLVSAAASHARHSAAEGRPKGFGAGVEAMVLYLRDEVVLRNVGPHGEKFVPFVLTLFFFILFANLFGLIPYGSTATGNISVTATLAIITFIVVEIAGMRAQGAGYLSTIFYWNKDLPILMRVPMFLIMTPVEIVGKFTKPFALAIRLFANMTAGHVVVLALIGLIFLFPVAFFAPMAMSVAIMLLEIFVAFLQAFIFALLASVFIGQIRAAHH